MLGEEVFLEEVFLEAVFLETPSSHPPSRRIGEDGYPTKGRFLFTVHLLIFPVCFMCVCVSLFVCSFVFCLFLCRLFGCMYVCFISGIAFCYFMFCFV